MSFTYSDPSNSDLEAVRFLIGDTDSTDVQLHDAEITYLLTEEGNVYKAAAAAAAALAAKYSRKVDKAVGDLRISYSQRMKHYESLVAKLKQKVALRVGIPYAGGISEADKLAQDEDTDRVDPSFRRGQFDYPGGATDLDSDTWSTS